MLTSTLQKRIVQKNFNKAALSYDQNNLIQKEVCKDLIKLFLKKESYFPVVLDVACGTGESTKNLKNHIAYEAFYGMDLVGELLKIAQKKLINIPFIQGDFETSPFKDESVDLIFCSMGLQWSSRLEQVIKNFYKILKPKGTLAFALPLKDNFPELKADLKPEFFDHKNLLNALKHNGFTLQDDLIKTYRLNFLSQLELLKSIKSVGATFSKKSVFQAKPSQFFINPTCTTLTYEIGFYGMKK